MRYVRLFIAVVTSLLLAACSEPEAPGPAAKAPIASEPAVANQRSGEMIVTQYCLTCHGRGLYNAPKLDDVAVWQPRLAAGDELLWQSLLHGKQAMPARGSCFDCTDEELRAALTHLLAQVQSNSAP